MVKKPKAKKANATGRNDDRVGSEGRVLIVRRSLYLESPPFHALGRTSRLLFFELHSMFNGKNNGKIFLSCKDAADRLGLSDLKAISVAFDELRDLGFITETIGASFSIKADRASKARAWNLNWIVRGRCVGKDGLAPLDFTKLSKAQKRRVAKRSAVLSRYMKEYVQGKARDGMCTSSCGRCAQWPHLDCNQEGICMVPQAGY
jgi:hypothetical protein